MGGSTTIQIGRVVCRRLRRVMLFETAVALLFITKPTHARGTGKQNLPPPTTHYSFDGVCSADVVLLGRAWAQVLTASSQRRRRGLRVVAWHAVSDHTSWLLRLLWSD